MNIAIQDTVTKAILYGHQALRALIRNNRPERMATFRIPAELWIAILKVNYSHLPEVKAYLDAVDNGGGINPDNGKLLEAIDDVMDIDADDAQQLFSKINL